VLKAIRGAQRLLSKAPFGRVGMLWDWKCRHDIIPFLVKYDRARALPQWHRGEPDSVRLSTSITVMLNIMLSSTRNVIAITLLPRHTMFTSVCVCRIAVPSGTHPASRTDDGHGSRWPRQSMAPTCRATSRVTTCESSKHILHAHAPPPRLQIDVSRLFLQVSFHSQ
jgi:hypothetical protein